MEVTAAAVGKRKRSAGGCAHAANDAVVEELKKVRARLREATHLASNFNRAIASVQAHPEPIVDGQQARQLRHVGTYMANQIQAILNRLRAGASGSCAAAATTGGDASGGGARQKQRRLDPLPPMEAAIGEAESRPRPYAPARGKQPWFVLLVLQRAKAWDDDSAMALDELLAQITRSGFQGSMPKLKACLATLCVTHAVAKRTSSGGVFLTVKGQESADLCPGDLPDSVAGTTSGSSTSSSSDQSDASRSSSSDGLAAQAAAFDADVDIVLLSDLDTARPGSDADEPESEDEHEYQHDFDYGFDPDEEPPTLAERLERRLNPPRTVLGPPASSAKAVAPSEHREGDEWELVLLLDHREILSRRNRSILERKLLERGVTCEVRALNVGDVQWIARRHRPGEDIAAELMLNAIVERKEVHDLSGSIIDRRYFEQKARLSACGLTHVIYLVEGSLCQQTTAVRASGLHTAMCRTQVQNRFFVQLCRSADESVAFLASVHARLLAKFPCHACRNRERPAASPFLASRQQSEDTSASTEALHELLCRPALTFAAFNAQFRKRSAFTAGEMYQMMLLQAPGFSAARTAALAARFRSFHELREALEASQGTRGPLDAVRCGDGQRRLGAKTIKELALLLQAPDYSALGNQK